MISLFAGIALFAALGSLFVSDRSERQDEISWTQFGVALITAVGALFAIRMAQPPEAPPLLLNFGCGALAVLGAALAEKLRPGGTTVSIALGVLVAAYSQNHGGLVGAQAALAGAAVTAIALGSSAAMTTGFAIGGFLALTFLAVQGKDLSSDMGVRIGALLAVASLIPVAARKFKAIPELATSLAVPVFFGIATHLAVRASGSPDLGKLLVLPVVAGLAAHWLLPDEIGARPVSTNLVAGLLWLGGATLSFAMLKSAGLALWLVLGAGIPLALGNRVALGSAAPFAALVWYRMVSTDLTAGSDLSRFYVLTGLAAGIGIVAAGWEWRGRVDGLAGSIGGGLWALLAGGGAILAGLVFGSRGFVGSLEGSGLGSMLAGNHKRPLTPMLLSATMAMAGALCLPTLQQSSPFGRDEKMKLFISSAAAILVVAAILYALQIEKKKEVAR